MEEQKRKSEENQRKIQLAKEAKEAEKELAESQALLKQARMTTDHNEQIYQTKSGSVVVDALCDPWTTATPPSPGPSSASMYSTTSIPECIRPPWNA